MLRRFTKDIGRYKKGAVHNYPLDTWRSIARSAAQMGKLKLANRVIDYEEVLDSFSTVVDDTVNVEVARDTSIQGRLRAEAAAKAEAEAFRTRMAARQRVVSLQSRARE